MGVIRSIPLHLQCYEMISEAILDGQYDPGQALTEKALSENFGVSRGTIREAVRMLMKDGLIDSKKSGMTVYSPGKKELEELYLCRAYLESLAARLSAQLIRKEELRNLGSLIEKAKATSTEDLNQLLIINTTYHHSILLASKNETLIEMMKPIKSKMLFVRKKLFNKEFRNQDYLAEHIAIHDSLLKGDAELAEELMKEHIMNDLHAYLKLFEGGKR